MRPTRALFVLTMAALAGACEDAPAPQPPQPIAAPVDQLGVEVIRRFAHDEGAYTQGLVFHDGKLYESTGQYGRSSIRVLDPATGAVVERKDLAANVFGEGLAATDSALIQLTWKEFTAYYYDPETLRQTRTESYTGEGWGLCADGGRLYMTSGTDQLIVRDAQTFELLETLQVTRGGQPLSFANELECVGDHVWANIYGAPKIVKIDKRTGAVVAEVDGAHLYPPGVDPASLDHVLNGIAYNAASQTYFITGKLWPEMLEVRFVER